MEICEEKAKAKAGPLALIKEEEREPIQILVTNDTTIEEVLALGCAGFGDIKPEDYDVWTLNFFGEACKELRALTKRLIEMNITDKVGLVFQHKSIKMASNSKSFGVHFSRTGFPSEHEYFGKIFVDEMSKLRDVKEQIFDLIQPKIGFEADLHLGLLQVREYPRVKHPGLIFDLPAGGNPENQNDKYPGKVLTDDKSTIKKLKIQVGQLFVSLLGQLPDYQRDTLQLFLRKRNTETDTYDNYQEFLFTG
jgi:hypothetical protein